MSYIKLFVATPLDGESVERLNADKFTSNICKNVKGEWAEDVQVSVVVFAHDGGGETYVRTSNDIDADVNDFADAISNAYADASSYDG
jgi:hypothetical protein